MLCMRLLMGLIGMSNCFRKCILVGSLRSGRNFCRTHISQGGYRRFQSESELTASSAAITDHNSIASMYPPSIPTKDMSLIDLKSLLKALGGTAGTLRKAEILALCDQLLLQNEGNSEISAPSIAESITEISDDAESITEISNDEKSVSKKRNVRSLPPILPGQQSLEQCQLPTIKGDVNEIGSHIVQDLTEIFSAKAAMNSGNSSMDMDNTESDASKLEGDQTEIVPFRRNTTREYIMGGSLNTTGSMEFKDLSNGMHYWAHHPTGSARDERILDGPQSIYGFNSGGPGSGLGDMDITFLGTASCVPSLTRGVSCVAFRYNSDVWLIDCGEGSQQQMQKSRIRPSKISKIFITHLHGDHSFGLPGVLCLIGQATMTEREKDRAERSKYDRSDPRNDPAEEDVLDIYGPEGTRDYLRAVIQLTYSKVVHPYRIHELKDVPNLYVRHPRIPPALPQVRTRSSSAYGERPGGLDIYPDKDGLYFLFEEGQMRVQAAPTEHTVPCVGYVLTEKTKPGRLKIEDVSAAVHRNKKALSEKFKLRDPNKIFAVLKDMKPGSSLVFPDGTVVNADDILEPPRTGRKVVIMGDTCNSDMMIPIAMNADVVVHEATNAWIRDQDSAKYPTELDLERETHKHGHSTPQMAGRFVKKLNAKKLVMTHFSARYRGDDMEFNMKIMWRMEQMARRVTDLWGKNDVIAAWDQMCLPIRTREDEADVTKKENAIRAAVDLLAETGNSTAH